MTKDKNTHSPVGEIFSQNKYYISDLTVLDFKRKTMPSIQERAWEQHLIILLGTKNQGFNRQWFITPNFSLQLTCLCPIGLQHSPYSFTLLVVYISWSVTSLDQFLLVPQVYKVVIFIYIIELNKSYCFNLYLAQLVCFFSPD